MKKLFAILCVLAALILSACGSQNNTQNDNTASSSHENSSTEISKNEFITNDNIAATQSLSSQNNETTISASTTKASNEDANDVPPYILTESITDLRQIKAATETLSEAEFIEFMDKNFSTEAVNGMDTLESTKKLLNEMENTYIVFVDECDEDNVMAYYTESGDISYSIPINDEYYLCCISYTDSGKKFEYKEADIVKHLKTCEVDNIVFELYENTADETEGLYGNIKFDNICIPFYTNIKISAEQFENVTSRIGVVKIGDLLNQ